MQNKTRLNFFIYLLMLIFYSNAWSLDIAVISDLNGSYGSLEYNNVVKSAVNFLIESKPDLVMITGDMVAGQSPGLDYHGMWKSFHEKVSAPLTSQGIKLAITPGNHDASAESYFKAERAEYIRQWPKEDSLLTFLDSDHYPLYYSFSIGDHLFISLDATTVGPLDKAQKLWLKSELDKNQHFKRKILFGHIPLWPVVEGSKGLEILGDKELEAIMLSSGVEFYFSGHAHAFYPGFYKGLQLISQACLGSGPRAWRDGSAVSPRGITMVHFAEKNNFVSIKFFQWQAGQFIDLKSQVWLPDSLYWNGVKQSLSPYFTAEFQSED